jgi:methionyl-tRNA formyltransferase
MTRTLLVGAVESTDVALQALIAAGTPPVALLTLPTDALSRHSDAVELGSLAKSASIPVIYSTDVNSEETHSAIRNLAIEVTLVIGWSQICKSAFRNVSSRGCIGFHPSELPRLRGRAVIPWTILTRQTQSGATFFWLDDGVDTGDILLQRHMQLATDETARSLYDKQLQAIGEMLPEVLREASAAFPNRVRQIETQASYCAKRTAEDGLIDWRDNSDNILVLIRAVGDPYPGAFTYSGGAKLIARKSRPFPDGARFIGMAGQVQLLTSEGFVVRCGDGACVEIVDWQWQAGSKPARHSMLGKCG